MAGELILVDQIEPLIQAIRGQNVILDGHLAKLYRVAAKRLNEQVRRNHARFPSDFMFQLTAAEATALRSQNATLKRGRSGHSKYLPLDAFRASYLECQILLPIRIKIRGRHLALGRHV
jgi:hypothetical protein